MAPRNKPRKAERSERESMSEMEPPTHDTAAHDTHPPGAAGGVTRQPHGRGPGHRKEDWIASQLRRVYDGAAGEEIPSRMLDLLKALDDSEGEGRG